MTTTKTHKAPGKYFREGVSVKKLLKLFPDDQSALEWLQERIWKGSPHCHRCGSLNVNLKAKHPTMPYRCNDCKKQFSIRTGTVMESSKISLQDWAIAMYLFHTNLKGISSMRLHRELEVTQRTAWFILHRLRETNALDTIEFDDVVEIDETSLGGKVSRMSKSTKKRFVEKWGKEHRGSVGKTIVVGIKQRDTKQIQAKIVPSTKRKELLAFALEHTAEGATIFTDEALGYVGIDKYNRSHHTINHSIDEYAIGDIHTNGIESFWFPLKEGMRAVYHHVSEKHKQAYVDEYAGRFNLRDKDTIDQMGTMAYNMKGKRLKYKDLIA